MDICGYCSIQITGSVIRFHLRLFSPLVVLLSTNAIVDLSRHLVNKTIRKEDVMRVRLGEIKVNKFEMVDRRRSKDFSQVTGYIAKELAIEFKVACTRDSVSQSDVLEMLVKEWLEKREKKSAKTDKSKSEGEE